MQANNEDYIWKDRKRTILGLPISFTIYKLTSEKIIIQSGVLNLVEEEIRLYRVMDVTLKRSLYERIFNLGTIKCCSADQTTPEFEIKNVKDARKVKELISTLIEESRDKKKITGKEFLTHGHTEML